MSEPTAPRISELKQLRKRLRSGEISPEEFLQAAGFGPDQAAEVWASEQQRAALFGPGAPWNDPEKARKAKVEKLEQLAAERGRLEVTEDLGPYARKGIKAEENARRRGKARKGTGIDREQLRADVAEWWAKYPHHPRSEACRAVLRLPDPNDRQRAKYPIKLRTAMEYTKGLPKPE